MRPTRPKIPTRPTRPTRGSGLTTEEQLLDLLKEKYGQEGKPKASPLQRIFAPLQAVTSVPDVIYKGMYEDKNPILEYIKNIGRGMGTTFLGHEAQDYKKTSDIAMKEGFLRDQNPITKATRFGLDLAGDIATSPLSYIGFLPTALSKTAATSAVKAAAGSAGLKGKAATSIIDDLANQVSGKGVSEAIKIVQNSPLGHSGAESFYTNLLATQNLKAAGGVKFMGQTISKSPKVADAVKMAINPLYAAGKGVGAVGEKVAPKGMEALRASWYDVFDPLKAAAMSGKEGLALQSLKTQAKQGQVGQDAVIATTKIRELLNKIPKESQEGLADLIQKTRTQNGMLFLDNLPIDEAVSKGVIGKNIGDFLTEYGKHSAGMTKQLAGFVGMESLIDPKMQTYIQQMPKTMSKDALRKLFPDEDTYQKILSDVNVQRELGKGATKFGTVQEALRGKDVLAAMGDKKGPGLSKLFERTFKTMEEGRSAGITYETDINKIIQEQTTGQLKRLNDYDFGRTIKDMVDSNGRKFFSNKMTENMNQKVNLPGIVNEKGRQIGLYTDSQTKRVLQNYFDKFSSETGMDKTLQGLDKIMYTWKGLVTGKGPGAIRYHTRNHFDDNLRMVLGGADIRTLPADYQVSGDLLKYNRLISEVGEEETKKRFSSEAINKYLKATGRTEDTAHTLWREMKNTGTLSDVGRTFEEAGTRYIPGQSGAIAKGLEKGSEFEQYRRMAMYLNNYRKTGNSIEAHQAVRDTLFNYLELSKTERNVMKRLMPFYAFTKNNLKFQFNTMFQEPQKYSRFINVLDSFQNAMTGPDQETWDLMPEWLQDERYSVLLGKKGDTAKVLSNFGLSFEDLEDLDSQGMISKMNPLLKLGIELSTGKSTFMRKPIEELRGGHRYEHHPLRKLLGYEERERGDKIQKTVDPQRRYLAENLPYVSSANLLLQQLSRIYGPAMQGDKAAAGKGLAELSFPPRVYEVDLEQQRKWKEVEDLDELYKLLYRKGISDRFSRFYIPADIREQLLRELR